MGAGARAATPGNLLHVGSWQELRSLFSAARRGGSFSAAWELVGRETPQPCLRLSCLDAGGGSRKPHLPKPSGPPVQVRV